MGKSQSPVKLREGQMIALRELIARHDPRQIKSERVPASERPIAFNDEMMRALIAGRKTETRRPVNAIVDSLRRVRGRTILLDRAGNEITCRLASVGGRLWVRERWSKLDESRFVYACDGVDARQEMQRVRWRPAFQMPRAASRMLLHVDAIRAQRAQQITSKSARAEGFPDDLDQSPREWFADVWARIYREPPLRWEDNPWVWVIQFTIASPGESPGISAAKK